MPFLGIPHLVVSCENTRAPGDIHAYLLDFFTFYRQQSFPGSNEEPAEGTLDFLPSSSWRDDGVSHSSGAGVTSVDHWRVRFVS